MATMPMARANDEEASCGRNETVGQWAMPEV